MTQVLVIGAGITGLSAAWEAMRAGARVTLVEASPWTGGKVRTERVDGFVIEHGPDSFVSYRPAALGLINDLGMSDEVISVGGTRAVHLRAEGRLLPLPEGMGMVLPTRMGPFVRTPILSWRHKARAGLDLVLPRRLGPADISAGAFLRARLGDGVVDRFAQPLIGGIYGAGIDELSLDAVLPTLRTNEQEHRSLMVASLAQGRDARRRARDSGAPAPGSPFRSLRAGLGALPERLEADLRAGGADVRLATRVERLEPDSTGTAATFSDGSVERFDAVVLAVGAAAMAELVEPAAPGAAGALRAIPHSTTTVVTLAYADRAFGSVPTTQGWLEAGEAPISGVTISSNKWAGRAPGGFVLLRAFVPQRRGPLASAPDDEVLSVVTAHIGSVLGIGNRPSLTRVTRWTQAMPTYTVGHLDRVAAVEAALAQVPGWHAAGSALHGVGVPECIADGRRVAREAVAGIGAAPAPR
ncbi:MAG TPA: protoporphyrinogen oxidase [Motilibacterales bacterium]|nr:protoporphyrinogen oxidase [Motilibacterales bacterium]